nr:hypothetical protein [Streptomyces sp. MUM 2J]
MPTRGSRTAASSARLPPVRLTRHHVPTDRSETPNISAAWPYVRTRPDSSALTTRNRRAS